MGRTYESSATSPEQARQPTVRIRTDEPAVPGAPTPPRDDHLFDIVIRGGRVMDPESGFDRVADVGIDEESIRRIGLGLRGRTVIDAAGLVVAPGFIDVLSYEPNPFGIWFKVADGVTTNLGMHGINQTVDEFVATYGGRTPTHIGGAFDNPFMRYTRLGLGIGEASDPAQEQALARMAAEELDRGWLGVDFEPEYTPGVTTSEMIAIAAQAAARNRPAFFHVRYSDPERNDEAIAEVLQVARSTGASVHVDHVSSTGGLGTMERTLETLESARDEGVDVTADVYPYDFWATTLGAERFSPDPRDGRSVVERFGVEWEHLVVVGTGERLTRERFEQLRRAGENPLVAVIDSIPEQEIEAALRSDLVMVASDAIPEKERWNHPRAAGTFARLFARYVRERATLTLMEAIAKCSLLPARRLEQAAPVMRRKGRVQVGADADLVVFDPQRIEDRATLEEPRRTSAGIEWVLVSGRVVKTPLMKNYDDFDQSVLPGRVILPS